MCEQVRGWSVHPWKSGLWGWLFGSGPPLPEAPDPAARPQPPPSLRTSPHPPNRKEETSPTKSTRGWRPLVTRRRPRKSPEDATGPVIGRRTGPPRAMAPPVGPRRTAGRTRVRRGPPAPAPGRRCWAPPGSGCRPGRSGTGSGSCRRGSPPASRACCRCPGPRSRSGATRSASEAAACPPATSGRTGPPGRLRGKAPGTTRSRSKPGPAFCPLCDPRVSHSASLNLSLLVGKMGMIEQCQNFCED